MKNKEKKESLLKSIIIMRHGERIDCVDSLKNNQILSEYDPELTEKGIKQAKDIGNQIKKSIKKEIDTLNIYSSPFTRTIMTGLYLAKILNLKNNNIFITNSLFEIASENNFKYFPINSLLINNKNKKNNVYEKFILNNIKNLENCIIKEYKNRENNIKYPETFNEAVERYNNIAEDLFEEIIKDENNSLNIIVTHGYGVQIITEYLFNKTKNKEELFKKEVFFVDYCTSYCFNFLTNKDIKFIGRIEPSFD